MNAFDFLSNLFSAYPWILSVLIGIVVLLFIVFIGIALITGREITIFWIFKIGPKSTDSSLNSIKNKIMKSSSNVEEKREFVENLEKVKKIKAELPEQSIYTIALRSRIHHTLFEIALIHHGGWAGVGYPGKKPYLDFTTVGLLDKLPEYVDVYPGKLNNLVTEYFKLTEPNIYGVKISDDDFQLSLQNGIAIINWLERLHKLIVDKGHIDLYTEEDILKYS